MLQLWQLWLKEAFVQAATPPSVVPGSQRQSV